jgi:hypothetical protein
MDPCDADVVTATVAASPRQATYGVAVDRESAREMLATRLEQGAAGASQQSEGPGPGSTPKPTKPPKPTKATKPTTPARAPKRPKREPSVVEQVVTSSAFKDFMRTAAREVARGMFSTARRR